MLQHPEIPTCADCQKFVYNVRRGWKKDTRGGLPVVRPPGAPPPCWECPKSKDGLPNPGAELSDRNWRAWRLWLEIKAGRPVPDDRIVWRNCGLIGWAEESVRSQQQSIAPLAMALFRMGSK